LLSAIPRTLIHYYFPSFDQISPSPIELSPPPPCGFLGKTFVSLSPSHNRPTGIQTLSLAFFLPFTIIRIPSERTSVFGDILRRPGLGGGMIPQCPPDSALVMLASCGDLATINTASSQSFSKLLSRRLPLTCVSVSLSLESFLFATCEAPIFWPTPPRTRRQSLPPMNKVSKNNFLQTPHKTTPTPPPPLH